MEFLRGSGGSRRSRPTSTTEGVGLRQERRTDGDAIGRKEALGWDWAPVPLGGGDTRVVGARRESGREP